MADSIEVDLDKDSSDDCAPLYLKSSEMRVGDEFTWTVTGAGKYEYKDEKTGTTGFAWYVTIAESPSRVKVNKGNHDFLCKTFGGKPSSWLGQRVKVEIVKTKKLPAFEFHKA